MQEKNTKHSTHFNHNGKWIEFGDHNKHIYVQFIEFWDQNKHIRAMYYIRIMLWIIA